MSIKVLFMGAVLTLFVSNVFAQSAAVKSACNSAIKELDRCVAETGETPDDIRDLIKAMMTMEGNDQEIIKACNDMKEELTESDCYKY